MESRWRLEDPSENEDVRPTGCLGKDGPGVCCQGAMRWRRRTDQFAVAVR